MKKLFVLFLIFVILITGCTSANLMQISSTNEKEDHQEPPNQIIFHSTDEIAEFRKLAETDEKEVLDFIQKTSLIIDGIENRKDVVEFLKFADSLPIPVIPETKLIYMSYTPEYQDFTIFYKSKTEERYSFSFYFGETNAEQAIKDAIGQDSSVLCQKESGRIKVYQNFEKADQISGAIRFLMNIDGYFVQAGYRNDDIDFSDVSDDFSDKLYKEITISTLKELTD